MHKSVIGLTAAQFEQLFVQITPTMYEIDTLKLNPGRSKFYSPRESLYVFLLHIRQNPRTTMLRFACGVVNKTRFVGNDTIRTSLALSWQIMFKWAEKQIVWPDTKTRLNNRVYFAHNEERIRITVVGDNSKQQIVQYENSLAENATYSGKASTNTFSRFHLVSPQGKAYFISKSFEGSMNDAAVTNLIQPHKMITLEEGMALDQGYPNIKGPNILKKKNGSDRERNRKVDLYRVVVENHFGGIKKWAICDDKFRLKLTRNTTLDDILQIHHEYWTIVTGLYNVFVAPLRNWSVFHNTNATTRE
jgi:hypothetical protein